MFTLYETINTYSITVHVSKMTLADIIHEQKE